MKVPLVCLFLFIVSAGQIVRGEEPAAVSGKGGPAFVFKGVGYFHRWSEKDQHEFTPAHQEDLKKWSDMVTINAYRDAHDGERLAFMTNAVLENYKSHRAVIVKTNSIPRTADKPAEHLIVALFPQPAYIEAAFARFRLVEGIGCSCVYSHRVYGTKAGDEMSAWLTPNGPATEKALLGWTSMPSLSSLSRMVMRWPTSGEVALVR